MPTKFRLVLRWLVTLAVCVVASTLLRAQGPQRALGLVLATPEQLQGIPLASTPYSGGQLPRRIDLSPSMPPPLDQGQQNSCVAWSVAYAMKSYQERLEEHRDLTFSPAFIYNQINQGRDGGSSYIDALNLLRSTGAAPWSDMPYDARDFTRAPSQAAKESAARYRIDTWRQVNVQDTVELKAHLNAGYPVLIGARVDDGFIKAGRNFVWNFKDGNEAGGHAMVLVGYDDDAAAFKVMNSWGRGWGDDGFSRISYEHLRRVVREAYVAKDALNGPAPQPNPTPPPTSTPLVNRTPAATPFPTTRPTPSPSPWSPNTPYNPYEPSVARRPVQFGLTNVMHNTVMPSDPGAGYFMRFDGTLDIPPGWGSRDQVVINFWFDAGGGRKGQMVRSYVPQYSTVYGNAACGTAVYPVPPQGLRTTWTAWIPYSAMALMSGGYVNTPYGRQYEPYPNALIAEPVLYVDGFGIANGAPYAFGVRR